MFLLFGLLRLFPSRAMLPKIWRQAFCLYKGEVERRTCPLQVRFGSLVEEELTVFEDLEIDSLKVTMTLSTTGSVCISPCECLPQFEGSWGDVLEGVQGRDAQKSALRAIGEFESFEHELSVLLAWSHVGHLAKKKNAMLSFTTAWCQQMDLAPLGWADPSFVL